MQFTGLTRVDLDRFVLRSFAQPEQFTRITIWFCPMATDANTRIRGRHKKITQQCNAIDTLIGRMTDGQSVHHTELFSGFEAFKRSNSAYGSHLIRLQRTPCHAAHTLLIPFNPNPNTREVNIFSIHFLLAARCSTNCRWLNKNRVTRLHIRFGSGDDGVQRRRWWRRRRRLSIEMTAKHTVC